MKMDLLALLELLDPLVHRDNMEYLGSKVKMEMVVSKVPLDLLDNLGSLVYQEPRVVMEDLEHLGLKVLKETKVTLDQMAHLDPLAMMANMEREVHLVQKERRENQGYKEVQVQEVLLVWKDQKETLGHLASLEILENKDLEELRENLEILVIMAERETEEFKEILDLQDNLDYKDPLENL